LAKSSPNPDNESFITRVLLSLLSLLSQIPLLPVVTNASRASISPILIDA
jgi:hypothetical protein